MGRDMNQTSQTPGTTAWGPMPNATQMQAKQHHLGPALEPGLGGGQAAMSCPTGTPGSLPLSTIHPQTTLCYACLSSNATQTQGQRENNPHSGEPTQFASPPPLLALSISQVSLFTPLPFFPSLHSEGPPWIAVTPFLSRTFGVQEP